ncbi:MAG: cupin-like domain-containing protein [Acidobacteria bacterium]|nr:cupin-like domain-containing protein [Acidobacteriota bacterium]MCB9396807.1 cupin-like domain-containing protein [Acidobacteriota bacterium]
MNEKAYRLWLAENLGLGIPFSQLCSRLPSPHQTQSQTWQKEWLDHPIRKLHEQWRAQEETLSQVLTLMTQAQWGKIPPEIPKVKKISAACFLGDYYSQNRPILLDGLIQDWPVFRQWSPPYLRRRWGSLSMSCQRKDLVRPKNVRCPEKDAIVMPFSEVLHDFISDDVQGAFIVANNRLLQQTGFEGLIEGIEPLPSWMCGPNRLIQTHWWMGPSGTYTPWHHDSLNILFCQIWGHKRIRLVPATEWVWMQNQEGVFGKLPKEAGAKNATPHVTEMVLEPGQALFLPVGWWHEVESLSPSLSVALTHFSFPNAFEWIDPTHCTFDRHSEDSP